jgi:hypothetical protein
MAGVKMTPTAGVRMNLFMRPGLRKKVKENYGISFKEIKECFLNREKGFLIDERGKYDYPSLGFVAKTDRGWKLKIIFVYNNGVYEVKAAYPAKEIEEKIYDNKA